MEEKLCLISFTNQLELASQKKGYAGQESINCSKQCM